MLLYLDAAELKTFNTVQIIMELFTKMVSFQIGSQYTVAMVRSYKLFLLLYTSFLVLQSSVWTWKTAKDTPQ